MSFGENAITYLKKYHDTNGSGGSGSNTILTINGQKIDSSKVDVTVDSEGNVAINGLEVANHDSSQIRVGTEIPNDLKDGELFGIILEGDEE